MCGSACEAQEAQLQVSTWAGASCSAGGAFLGLGLACEQVRSGGGLHRAVVQGGGSNAKV